MASEAEPVPDAGWLTRAERKQQRRAQKEATRTAAKSAAKRWRAVRWAAALLVLGGIVGGAVWTAGRGGQGAAPGAAALAVQGDDWVKGSAQAAVTLVEYGDFQCPACAAYYPLVKQLEQELGDRVRIVYRHFPLEQTHPHARPAAQAAEAAGKQGKFWEMHDLLFGRQGDWATAGDPRQVFEGYAGELGLDVQRFAADLGEAALDEKISAQRDGGVRLRVAGTPTFFLNGERLELARTYDGFKQRVLDVLESSS